MLAHFIADFPLQTDKIFALKSKYSWGVIVHGSIAGILGFVFAARYLKYPDIVGYLFLLWATHIIIDRVKLILNKRMGKENVYLFLSDQVIHLFLIFSVCQTPNAKIPLPLNIPIIGKLCNSDLFVQYLIGYIIVTYVVMILIFSLKSTFKKPASIPGVKKKLFEFTERGLITTFVILGGIFYWLILICAVPRFVLSFKKEPTFEFYDVVLSLVLTLPVGFILKII